MRYSVLLPTRNGGAYLPHCIASILEQGYDDFELVISDNANTDATKEVLRGLADDPRVTVVGVDKPVSVTDNWNLALSAAQGEYLLMMGDDDALVDGYFHRMDALLARHGDPDCVTYNGYSFVAPGSIRGNRLAMTADPHFSFGPDLRDEHLMTPEERTGIVHDMFRFRPRIPLNMQTTLVGRRAAQRVPGGLFQPPFPDHYALNSLLLKAERYVVSPEKLVIVGVTPKSFGHYYYGNDQAGGMGYLGAGTEFPGRLPGEELLAAMHAWLLLLKRQHPELADVAISRFGYVLRVVHKWCRQYEHGDLGARQLWALGRSLHPLERTGILVPLMARGALMRLAQAAHLASNDPLRTVWRRLRPLPEANDITQFRELLRQRAS
ncbi:MAG: glycosyltransferase family A protein [Thermoplasmatota archaeon]